ncbi:MAG: putative quinol monooxygenase [Bacillota bacterium]|nr:putative quinol monooxygenase [Bacillota bacterium]
MASITINAILKAKPGKEQLLREELVKVIQPSRAEKGCIEYTLHESLEDRGVFVFYETWKDEESLKFHTETDHYQEYRQNVSTLLDTREVYRLQKTVQ